MSRRNKKIKQIPHQNRMPSGKIPERVKALIESRVEKAKKLKKPLSKYQRKVLEREMSLRRK